MRGLAASGALLAALLTSTPVKAVFDTGNELHGYCSSAKGEEMSFCLGLITGYYEGFTISFSCKATEKVTRGQLRDVVLKFLNDNPQDRHRPAAILAARAYLLAFSCTKIP